MTDPQQLPVPGAVRTVAFAADHAGFGLKDHLASLAAKAGYAVVDLGTNDPASVDYPDLAERLARCVTTGEADTGVVVCGTGIGVSIAANKVPGARAAVVHDQLTAYYSRAHNDANVLCLGARIVGEAVAEAALATFLGTEFAGGRHARRVDLFTTIEESSR